MTVKSEKKPAAKAEEKAPKKKEEPLAAALAERDEDRRKADEYLDMARRLQADFDNYRKRTERENEEYRKYATRGLVTELLDIVDDLDRALASAGDGDPLAAGVAAVRCNLTKILEKQGLGEVPVEGGFDPGMHEALMVCEGDEEGRIAEVYQKGYMMDGRVLRYAKVRVTKRKGPAPEPAKGMAGAGTSENDKEND